jgi:uncharacterized protein YkwD
MKWCILLVIILVLPASHIAFLCIAGVDEPIGSRLTAEEMRKLLSLHNKARGCVGVGPLIWSKNMALYAQSWADHLASTGCTLEHRPYSGRWKQEHGENLFIGTVGYYGAADAVRAWEVKSHYIMVDP